MPLLWVSLLFISGIVVGNLLSLPVVFWLTLIVATLVLVFVFTRIPWFSDIKFPPLLVACTVALFLGAGRYQFAQPDITPKHIAFYNDRTYDLLVTGFVSDLPDYRDTYTNLRIQVQAVDTGDGDFPVKGLILVRVSPNQEYHYGQILRLRGKLETPPEDEEFSYRDYLAGKNIYSYMSIAEATLLPEEGGNFVLKAVYAFKEKSLDNIYHIFPDPEASLLAGILLGVDSGLPKGIQQAFKNTGTSHIIAISGFNIAIIAGIFTALFSRWFGPRRGAAAAVIFIFLYTFLVGAEASVVRAAIMGSFGLFARQVGRRQMAINTLLAVAAIMCIVNPLFVWDVGFQLSFFATLGLILYSEPFSNFSLRIIGRFTSPDNAQRINAPFSDFVLLTSDHGLSFQTNLARFNYCQSLHPARTTCHDDHGRPGPVAQLCLASAWTARGVDRLAVLGLYHPRGGIFQLAVMDSVSWGLIHLVRRLFLRGASFPDLWPAAA
jgi:competence protein ComEC